MTRANSSLQFLRDSFCHLADDSHMSNAKHLSENFKSIAADTAAISQQAMNIASTAPADKAEIAFEISAVATSMANMANRISETLRSSLLHSKKAA